MAAMMGMIFTIPDEEAYAIIDTARGAIDEAYTGMTEYVYCLLSMERGVAVRVRESPCHVPVVRPSWLSTEKSLLYLGRL